MRILLFSNPLSYSSGYSVNAYYLCKTLQLMNHEIYAIDCAIPSTNSVEEFTVDQLRAMYEQQHPEFLPNFEERNDVLSKVRFLRYFYNEFPAELDVKEFNKLIDKYKIDYVLFFIDIWIIKAAQAKEEKVRFHCKSITWLPLHFDPVEQRTIDAAELFDTIVCLAKDGVKKLTPLFPDKKIVKVPHVIDFEKYNTDAIDIKAVRKSMGIAEDCYLVTLIFNNSENTNRKAFETNFEAFDMFRKRHPDRDIKLYVHSRLDGAMDVNEIINFLEIPKDTMIVSEQSKMGKGGYTFDFMVNLYKVSNVLLAATASEGFGCPSVESQAVGTPVVVTNTTAMPDNLFNGELADTWDAKFCYLNTSRWHLPDLHSVVDCLDKIYKRTPEESKRKGDYGMKMVRENYNLQTLYDGFKPLIV